MSKLPKLLVILGPTASGKSAVAISLAKKFDGEIISADSRQIYKGMDIGTSKVTQKEMRGVRHYLLDIKNPDEPYTVAGYKKDALRAIRSVLRRKKLPILVGGTGLYIQAITDNLDIPAVPPSPALRKKLEARLDRYGLAKLFEELVKLDPEAAYIVDGKNPRRVLRALEVAIITGKPFTSQKKKGKKLFETLKIGLNPADLKERIEKRGKLMGEDGLAPEVKGLIKKYGKGIQALDAIGYREIIQYLNGDLSLKEALELMIKNTKNYAKRQMTWFKRDKEIRWIKNEKEVEKLARKFLAL
jgi:tRNA dimethylallyltransferase